MLVRAVAYVHLHSALRSISHTALANARLLCRLAAIGEPALSAVSSAKVLQLTRPPPIR